MRQFEFTESEIETFKRDRFLHPHPLVQKKMEVMWLKSQGETHARIATLAGCSRRSVQRYLDEYEEGGLDRLRVILPRGARPSELVQHEATIEKYFEEHPPQTIDQACAEIERLTGVRRQPTQVRLFLRDVLGFRFRKVAPIPVPPKKTPEEHAAEQAEFLANKLEPRLQEARDGERRVFFVDAAHFVFAPFLGCIWCMTRMFVKSPSGRKRYNVLGAIDAVTHEVLRITNHTYINSESVCDLLIEITARNFAEPVTLVLDNARYQRCRLVQDLAEELGIELMFLPSYSPNLNLIERLWRFVKKKALYSIYYSSYKDFQAAIDQCLDELTTTWKTDIATMMSHKFQKFENVPFLAA